MKLTMACLAVGLAMAMGRVGAMDAPGAQGNTYSLRITSLKQARFRQTIHQQYDFSCGSAAVATLLTYQYGTPVDEKTAFAEMYNRGDRAKINREGFSLLDIKRFLASLGFAADGFEVPLDKLRDEGLPAIALVVTRGYHHFVVVKGIRDGRVLLGDPATGLHSMARSRFEAMWPSHLLFVIHNHHELARFNDGADWAAAPMAPLSDGVDRRGLDDLVRPRRGPGDI